MAGELERQLLGLRQGDHLCHISDGPAEHLAVLVPFVRDGLARRERCVCAAEPPALDALIQALQAVGIDVERERQHSALALYTPRETWLRSGAFDPTDTLNLMRQLQEQSQRDGFAGLRAAGDMTWAATRGVGGDRLMQYAALLNDHLAAAPAIILCQYPRTRFKPAVLQGLLRSHPIVVLGEQVCRNLYYEPSGFAVEAPGPDLPARRVDWMLGQLRQGRAAEQEREHLLEQLRVSEERYRHLFDRGLAAVFRSTPDGRLLDCNEAFAAILGYTSRAEAMEQKVANFYFQPADREGCLTALRGKGTMTNHEMCMRRKDGRPVWVLLNSSLLTNGDGTITIEGTFVDISARKQAEEATLLTAARYRALIEQLGEGIFLKDRELRFVFANKAFCRGVGCSPEAVIGRRAADFFPASLVGAFEEDDHRVLAGVERVEREQSVTVEDKQHLFRIVKTPVQDERGQVVGVLGIFWDVTDQRILEAQLRQAQKMEAVGLMAGGIAHDFNNLLAVILGNIALSLGGLSEHHPHRELLFAAERAGVQAAELTNRLLGFARQTILRPTALQLTTCMEESARLLHRTIDPRITLEIRPAVELWTVEADPGQMNQVLMNLCLNARDAMPEGGRLVLEATNVVIDEDVARQHVAARRGEFVRLRVSDTGQGIASEIRTRIFEPFFTTKTAGKGTGLGLAMVYGIVQQHQGWIDCISEVGKGTRFDIYLPRQGVLAAAGETAPAEKSAPIGGRETILLADDEPMIRTLGRTILQRYGYRVLLAEDGVEAVETYRQRQADIDLVILDLTMPRLSGHDALRQMLQINPNVRVLLASGYSAEHLQEEHSERIAGFLNKPYRPEKLAQTVREVLDGVKTGSR